MQIASSRRAAHSGTSALPLRPVVVHVGLAILFFGALAWFYLFDPFGFETPGRDTWHHIAVLRELMASPFHPSNPHIPTDESSRYYSPLMVLAALIGRALGWSPWALFGYLGALSCLALPIACWQFAGRYFRTPWAAPLFMTVLLFAWGAQFSHAGLHDFATLTSSAAYPATQTLILGIFSWALAVAALDDKHAVRRAAMGHVVLTALLVLTHQFSAAIMLAGTLSFLAFRGDIALRARAVLIAAVMVGGLASLLWPYYDPLDVVLSASDPRWESIVTIIEKPGFALFLAAPSLLGLGGLGIRQGKVRWEIALPAAVLALAYLALLARHAPIAHRMPAAIILYLQLGLTWLLLAIAPRVAAGAASRRVVPIMLGLFVVLSMIAGTNGLRAEARNRAVNGRMIPSVEAMARFVPPGAIAFASDGAVFPYQASGRRVVSIPRPEPVAPSLPERQDATDRFFAAATSHDERRALLAQWHASYIVFAPGDLQPATIADLHRFGPARHFVRDIQIIAVAPDDVR